MSLAKFPFVADTDEIGCLPFLCYINKASKNGSSYSDFGPNTAAPDLPV
jgi:hypothetical protein